MNVTVVALCKLLPVDCITEKKRTKDNPWTNVKLILVKRGFMKKGLGTRTTIEADEERAL